MTKILTQTCPPHLARMAGVGRQDPKKQLETLAPLRLCEKISFPQVLFVGLR